MFCRDEKQLLKEKREKEINEMRRILDEQVEEKKKRIEEEKRKMEEYERKMEGMINNDGNERIVDHVLNQSNKLEISEENLNDGTNNNNDDKELLVNNNIETQVNNEPEEIIDAPQIDSVEVKDDENVINIKSQIQVFDLNII